jgi:hypothetical protein
MNTMIRNADSPLLHGITGHVLPTATGLRALLGIALIGALTGCSNLPQPPRPVPDECWFARGEPLSFEGLTTLGRVGMATPDDRWRDSPVYVWITAEPVDFSGDGRRLTRGICGEVEDDAFVRENGSPYVWNVYPVP